ATSNDQTSDLRPFSWTTAGATVEHGAVGIGGYIVFYNATGPTDLIDPASGTPKPLATAGDCAFSDVSTNGSIACLSGSEHALKIFGNGQTRSIPLAQPRFAAAGAAYFNPRSPGQ